MLGLWAKVLDLCIVAIATTGSAASSHAIDICMAPAIAHVSPKIFRLVPHSKYSSYRAYEPMSL